MKKPVIVVIIVLILGFSYIWFSKYNSDSVKRYLFEYVGGMEDFIIKEQHQFQYYGYMELVISNSEKKKLMEKYSFNHNLNELQGESECEFISGDSNLLFHINKKDYRPQGYIVLGIEPNGNNLLFYMSFND